MNQTTELLETIYSQYENQSPFAVIIRVVLQVVLPAPKMDELFNNTAHHQYERHLLFSTLMVLMLEVVMRTSPSIHHFYRQHQDSISVSFQGTSKNVLFHIVEFFVSFFCYFLKR
ncbi:MAG: hypothetical protein LBC02_14885 [Planctomycetaceae bacterium]|nr:hypothetical protein [Planctomycetaceae bacterium]